MISIFVRNRIDRILRTRISFIRKIQGCFLSSSQVSSESPKQILDVSTSVSDERTKPRMKDNVHQEYLRRPLYGRAEKGNMVFKEANKVVLIVVAASFVFYSVFFFYKHIKLNYFLSPQEKARIDELRKQFPLNENYDHDTKDWLRGLLDLQAFSDIHRFWKKEDGGLDRIYKPLESRNIMKDDEFRDQSQVLPRDQTGREYHMKTLKDFDQHLRK